MGLEGWRLGPGDGGWGGGRGLGGVGDGGVIWDGTGIGLACGGVIWDGMGHDPGWGLGDGASLWRCYMDGTGSV